MNYNSSDIHAQSLSKGQIQTDFAPVFNPSYFLSVEKVSSKHVLL